MDSPRKWPVMRKPVSFYGTIVLSVKLYKSSKSHVHLLRRSCFGQYGVKFVIWFDIREWTVFNILFSPEICRLRDVANTHRNSFSIQISLPESSSLITSIVSVQSFGNFAQITAVLRRYTRKAQARPMLQDHDWDCTSSLPDFFSISYVGEV